MILLSAVIPDIRCYSRSLLTITLSHERTIYDDDEQSGLALTTHDHHLDTSRYRDRPNPYIGEVGYHACSCTPAAHPA
jgi:hypothetical protein